METSQIIDFTPLLKELVSLAAMLLSVMGTVLVGQLMRLVHAKTGVQLADKNEILHQTLDRVIARAAASATEKLENSDFGKVTTQSDAVKVAADTTMALAPVVVKGLGISRDDIEDMVRVKLGASTEVTAVAAVVTTENN